MVICAVNSSAVVLTSERPPYTIGYARLAQLVEQKLLTLLVIGSNPIVGAMQEIRLKFKSEVDRHDLGQILAYLSEKKIVYRFYLTGIALNSNNLHVIMALKLRFAQCFISEADSL